MMQEKLLESKYRKGSRTSAPAPLVVFNLSGTPGLFKAAALLRVPKLENVAAGLVPLTF